MALLGPVSFQADSDSINPSAWDWEKGFPSGDWSRFQSYIKRIKSLSYTTTTRIQGNGIVTERIAIQASAALLQYTAVNGGRYLLPRLHKIDWHCDYADQLRMALSFISSRIKDIKLVADYGVSDRGIVRALQGLSGVLPSGLRSFCFVPPSIALENRDFITAMRRLLEKQDDLQELRVPFFCMNPFMFKPKLQVLDVNCRFRSTVEIERLLSQLVQSCPLLMNLRILLSAAMILDPTIDFQTIRPLLQCTTLQALDIDWTGKFELDSRDICEMGRAWAELEILHLASRDYSNTPQVDGARGLPLNFLSIFAANLPRLRKLALHVSTQEIPFVNPRLPSPFPNLEVFCPGTSFLERSRDKVLEAFAFFSAILPKGAKLLSCDPRNRSPSAVSLFEPSSLHWPGMNLTTWGILNTVISEGVSEEVLEELKIQTQENHPVWELANLGEDWDDAFNAW
ncbi:hypothetical protein FRB90_000099 [Tulasnella sp. 427]|nr:hypothetical protein FRB90_000099 [Tulasnella sp. 427]